MGRNQQAVTVPRVVIERLMEIVAYSLRDISWNFDELSADERRLYVDQGFIEQLKELRETMLTTKYIDD